MNLIDLKNAVQTTLLEEYGLASVDSQGDEVHEAPLEYAMLMLNGGAELPFRTRLMAVMQHEIHQKQIAVTEWVTRWEGKEKRADIAVLNRSHLRGSPSFVVELKSNFLSQAGQVKGRFLKDVEKWSFSGCAVEKRFFIYWVTEIMSLEHGHVLKSYVKKSKNKFSDLQRDLSEVAETFGLQSENFLDYRVKTSYPFENTEFRTEVLFLWV